MSSPAPPRPSSGPSLSPTRQQLDDLEALMHRMLKLPVNHLGDEAPPAGESPVEAATTTLPRVESDLDRILAEFPARSWPPPEEPAAEERLAEPDGLRMPPDPTGEPVPPSVDLLPSEVLASALEPGLEEPADVSGFVAYEESAPVETTAEVPVPEPAAAPIERAWSEPPPIRSEPAAPTQRVNPPVKTPSRIPDEPPVPLPLRPLAWVNDGFDVATLCLGPLGRWLRGGVGRTLLGLTGLLLLAVAAAWAVLDWIGWTW